MDIFAGFFSPRFDHSVSANDIASTINSDTHALPSCVDTLVCAVPSAYASVNAAVLRPSFQAVIPDGAWESGDLITSFAGLSSSEACVSAAFARIRAADFLAFDANDDSDGAFLSQVVGSDAALERIREFSALEREHVHEAPVYLSASNELLYSDTSVTSALYALEIDTRIERRLTLDPALANVNGATLLRKQGREEQVFVATNGGSTRGIFALDPGTGATQPVVNHFRGRRYNSPNDLIFDSRGRMWFTDPTYGYEHKWTGVGPPELPTGIYRFDPKDGGVVALSTGVLGQPNGLALSPDERTLYVADSSSTGGEKASQRTVHAFEVGVEDGALGPPRLIHLVESGWPDGLRVTRSGLLMVAVAGGVDVVDPRSGKLLGKILTPDDIIFNLEPARGKGVWLLTGQKFIYKVRIKETGQFE